MHNSYLMLLCGIRTYSTYSSFFVYVFIFMHILEIKLVSQKLLTLSLKHYI